MATHRGSKDKRYMAGQLVGTLVTNTPDPATLAPHVVALGALLQGATGRTFGLTPAWGNGYGALLHVYAPGPMPGHVATLAWGLAWGYMVGAGLADNGMGQ